LLLLLLLLRLLLLRLLLLLLLRLLRTLAYAGIGGSFSSVCAASMVDACLCAFDHYRLVQVQAEAALCSVTGSREGGPGRIGCVGQAACFYCCDAKMSARRNKAG
jgi:hypothetical protein